MTPKLRNLALAAMSWGAAVSAQAAPTVLIDFETLAAQAMLPTVGKPQGTPMLLTNPVQNISFAGATVFHETQTTRSANYCCTAPVGHTGFIQTRAGIALDSAVSAKIVVELVGALAGGDIESITFDAATLSTDLEFLAFDGQGNKTKFDFNPSGTAWTWVGQTLNFASLGVIKRIEFVSLGGSSAVFALDNLAFTLANTGGGTVPEPAGLGLAALALAAMGITTRKRRA
jgi:hypothetical protein